MSTAVAAETGPTPDETIGRTVRALRSAYEVDSQDLARYLGISRQALYNRLNGDARWLAREVFALAQFFGCEINDLYQGNVQISATAPATKPVTLRYRHRNRPASGAVVLPFPQARAGSADRDRTPGEYPKITGGEPLVRASEITPAA